MTPQSPSPAGGHPSKTCSREHHPSTTQPRLGRLAWPAPGDLRLDPLVHGVGRVPGQRMPRFDLAAFAGAVEHQDVAYVLACYAPGTDIRIVDPDNPPPAARLVCGSRAIRSWLDRSDASGVAVTHVVDGGDRVAFTACWSRSDRTAVVATGTAELTDGLITLQHTSLAWARAVVGPIDGWTRVSQDLFTKTD